MTENEVLIKTPEEAIETIKSNMPTSGYQMLRESLDMAIIALKEIQQYREIGTVEECREAVEKQKPKQAEHSKWIGINGALYDLCPTCGTNLCTDSFLGEQKENYCGNCGQKLDWSEEE